MEIVVCVKQVPDVTEAQINPETNTLIREGVPSILNPFDEFAVEEAVRIKEKYGGTVSVITMGPVQAEQVLRTCLQMGADRGYLLCDDALAGSDTWVTSAALAALINKLTFDLIICGLETTDSSTAQVGPQIAEKLGIPQITFVSKIEYDRGGINGTLTHETDTGYQVLEARTPLLVSVVKGINVPRTPDEETGKGKKVERLTIADIDINPEDVGLDGSPTMVVEVKAAKPRPRSHLVVDSNLSAHERIRMIMSGGIQQKEESAKLEGEAESLAKKAGRFIIDLLKQS
jgi:electron transfer flavoprotein alpha/beta subunit